MKAKNHGRAAGQTQLTVALPETLKKELREIARKERRSTNNLVVLFLEESVTHYNATKYPSSGASPEGKADAPSHHAPMGSAAETNRVAYYK